MIVEQQASRFDVEHCVLPRIKVFLTAGILTSRLW